MKKLEEKWLKRKLTRKRAIMLFCRECMGYDGYRSGNVGTPFVKAGILVRECEDKKCPLWLFRDGKEEKQFEE